MVKAVRREEDTRAHNAAIDPSTDLVVVVVVVVVIIIIVVIVVITATTRKYDGLVFHPLNVGSCGVFYRVFPVPFSPPSLPSPDEF